MDLFRKRKWIKKRIHWLVAILFLLNLNACTNVPSFSTRSLQKDIRFLNKEHKEIQALELTGDFHIFIPDKRKHYTKEIKIIKEEKIIDITPFFEDVEAGVIAKVSLEEAGTYRLKVAIIQEDRNRITKESKDFKLIVIEDMITWEFTDRSGNEAAMTSSEIVKDVDKARISMFLKGKEITELPTYLDHELELDVEIQDSFLDLKQSFIQDQEDVFDVKWQQDGDMYRTTMNLAEGKHKLIVEAVDQGMRTSRLETNTFVIDTTTPKTTVRYALTQESIREEQVMNIEIVDMTISVEDVLLMVTMNKEVIQPLIQWEQRDDGLHGQVQWHQEGEYEVDLKVQDKAGNASLYRKQEQREFQNVFEVDHFVLDKTRPMVTVNYDANKDSAHYATHRQASIVVQEKNFSEDLIQLQVKRDEKLEDTNIVWESKDDVHTGVVQFQKDGEYSIALQVKDRAQNVAMYQVKEQFLETYPDDTFLIDTISPQIHVTGMPSSTFTNQDVTLEYLVEDKHLQQYSVLVMRNSTLYLPALRIGEEGGKQSITIPAKDMGTYDVKLMALDTSGNQSVVHLERFIIDSQAPHIELYVDQIPVTKELSYTSNQSSNISIAWQDEYLKNASIVLLKDGVVQPITIGNASLEMDLVMEKDQDVFYEVKIMMEDEAGNQSTRELQLHQDSFLPKLEIANDIFQGKAARSSWTPQLTYENDEFHVMEASLYRNQRAVSDYMWGDEIYEEGVYTLRVSVRDDAMNESYLLPFFPFTIDKTPPEIHFTRGDNTHPLEAFNITKDDELHLYVEDEREGRIATTLRVDQTIMDCSLLKEDALKKTYIPIHFDEEKTYEIEVEAVDEAGNRSYQIEKVSVDQQNIPQLKENHKPVSSNYQSTRIAVMAGFILALNFFMFLKKRYDT